MRSGKFGSANHLFQLPVLGIGIAVVGLLAYRQVARIAHPSRAVVVAAVPLAAGHLIEKDDVKVVRRSADDVAPGAYAKRSEVEDRRLTRAKGPGEPILAVDFQPVTSAPGKSLSRQIPEGRVLTTLTLQNLTLPAHSFKQGDRVDILIAAHTQDRRRRARVVVRDAYVVGYVTPVRPRPQEPKGLLGRGLGGGEGQSGPKLTALLIALQPDEVLPVAEIDGSGQHVSLVLHSDEEDAANPLVVSGGPPPRTVDLIVGANRERVLVQ